MEDVVYEGVHAIESNIYKDEHAPVGSWVKGVHVQNWFGDRFVNGIQAENLEFIRDQIGDIIFEE